MAGEASRVGCDADRWRGAAVASIAPAPFDLAHGAGAVEPYFAGLDHTVRFMSGAIAVTDHALVRWLERSGAMDVAAMRSWLEASLERAAEAANRITTGQYLILADGMVFVCRDGVVVTVLEEDGRHSHARRLADRDGQDVN